MFDLPVVTATVAAGLFSIGCTAGPSVDVEAEAQAIRELDRQWLATFVAKDIDGAMEFFAPDAELMPARAPAIVGRESIREWLEAWLPNPAVTSTFVPDVIVVAASGDLAYDRGTYHFTMDTAEGRVRDSGKYLVVWQRIANEWKAIYDISNSDLASPVLTPLGDPATSETGA